MNEAIARLRARWAALAPREKAVVAAGLALVTLAIIWWVLIGPALSTLRTADAQHRTVDTQLQRIAALRTEAQSLQSQPRQGYDEALRQLEQSVRQRLGANGRITVTGDRATVSVSGVSPDALAQWLQQARTGARVAPGEAHLVRNPNGAWDGTLVVSLPPRS